MRSESQRAVKVEEYSRCVILTYFQGDANSMVDAHFNRALSKGCKAKAPGAKIKKLHKTIKSGKYAQSAVYRSVKKTACLSHPFFVCRRKRQPLSGRWHGLLHRVTGLSCGRTSP
uniref:Uncharacterized protein n=1 Tax=Echeneis naucrates TaxID=173247 RepID=A0A665TJP0_ECHNA